MAFKSKISVVSVPVFGALLFAVLQASPAMSEEGSKVSWTYGGATGADRWAQLSDKFAACDTGRLQSPFDITPDIGAGLADLNLDYAPVPLKVSNNGHTIQVDLAGAGHLSVDGKAYDLLQFHFHTPSEYTIDGETYPLEVHFVHASKSGELAVVGVMFVEGAANTQLAEIWRNMPSSEGDHMVDGSMVDAKELLPTNRNYYRFMGSLTTPPCSEGVNWHMMTTPIAASGEQIAAFKNIFPMNARPLQDENNRLVVIGR